MFLCDFEFSLKSVGKRLTDILYSTHAILVVYNGQSIVKEVIEVYSSEPIIYNLNVIGYKCKFYILENGNFKFKECRGYKRTTSCDKKRKICMGNIMFHSFTVHNIRRVDVILDEKNIHEKDFCWRTPDG